MINRLLPVALLTLLVGIPACDSGAPTDPAALDSGALISGASSNAAKQVLPGRYIVVLSDAVAPSAVRSVAERLAGVAGGRIRNLYIRAIRGFALEATAAGASRIASDPRVRRIDADVLVSVRPGPGRITGRNKAEEITWGVTRVGGSHDGTGRRAWIIDSGIDTDHPDLIVASALGASFVPGSSSTDDPNGHGTHVAGILGAVDNEIGTVGVAAGATLIPVRVLDRHGDGEASWVIAGIEHVLANARTGDVANMSFGAGLVPSIDEAVVRLANAGVRIAIAAGNDAANCMFVSPARVNHVNVFTVSAIDASDRFASFSNYGAGIVDFAAPGVDVLSARRGGGVVSMSGTSMAAPHVAGLLVAGSLRADTQVAIGDVDGQPDHIAIY